MVMKVERTGGQPHCVVTEIDWIERPGDDADRDPRMLQARRDMLSRGMNYPDGRHLGGDPLGDIYVALRVLTHVKAAAA